MTKEEVLHSIDSFKPEGSWQGPGPNYGGGFNRAKREISDWFSENYDEIVSDNDYVPSRVLFQITDDLSIAFDPYTVTGIEIISLWEGLCVKVHSSENIPPIECGKAYQDGEEKARNIKTKLEKELAKRGIEIVDLR